MQNNRCKFTLRIFTSLFFFILSGQVAQAEHNILDYGAVGDGKSLCTQAIQQTIDACAEAGGGTVIFPTGKFLTGALFLRSNICIELSAGATVLADTNFQNFPPIEGRYAGIEGTLYASLFTGHDLENVTLTGHGVLDGQGAAWWRAARETKRLRRQAGIDARESANPAGSPLKWARPRVINLIRCKNVLLRDLKIINSPSWTIHPVYCNNVAIEHISIVQPYESPNTDGINPESCQNVRISNCFVDCGDDCITIKSGYNEDGRRVNIPCENIVITNCTFAHGRSAVGIGSETSGGIRNVTISNCVFQGTLRGLRIKTARGRGNVVENIRAANIIMDRVGTGISLDMFYGKQDERIQPVNEKTPHFRNIRYSRITGTNLKKAGEILGLPEAPMADVVLSDLALAAEHGIEVKFCKNIVFRNVQIDAKQDVPLKFYRCEGVELDNFSTSRSMKHQLAIQFEAINGAVVRNCLVINRDTFLQLRGAQNHQIQLWHNQFPGVKNPVVFIEGATESALEKLGE